MTRMKRRVELALAVLRGDSVMYGMTLVPWAGPQPSDGASSDGWVKIGAKNAHVYIDSCDITCPVMVTSGSLSDVADPVLPYIWRPDVGA